MSSSVPGYGRTEEEVGIQEVHFMPPNVFPVSDDHIRCLKGMGEGSTCSICQTFGLRVCKDRQTQLQLLLKEAFEAKPSGSGQLLDPRSKRPVLTSVTSSKSKQLKYSRNWSPIKSSFRSHCTSSQALEATYVRAKGHVVNFSCPKSREKVQG